MEKGDPSYIVDGNASWYSHSGKVWRSLKKLKIELPYDPAIELLGIYPKDTEVVKRRGACSPVFIAAMSTIAKMWKELRCPSTDEWIKKTWLRASEGRGVGDWAGPVMGIKEDMYCMEHWVLQANNESRNTTPETNTQ